MDTLAQADTVGFSRRELSLIKVNSKTIKLAFEAIRDLPCAMLIVSEDGMVQMVNREAARLLAPLGSELLGKQLVPAGAPAEWLKSAQADIADVTVNVPAAAGNLIEYSARLSKWMPGALKAAPEFFSLMLSTPIQPSHGRDAALSTLFEVIPSVVHELRNPLSVITVTAELMAEDAESERMRESITDILHEVQRMKFSLNRMAGLSRSVRRSFPAPLSPAIQELAKFFKWVSNSKQIEFHSLIGPRLEAPFEPPMLCVLVHNILLNAFQACPEGGRIQLNCHLISGGECGMSKAESVLMIEVIDNGIGMEEKVLHRCREPLFSTRRNGAGLGLYMCEEMVKESGGQLLIQSSPGEGTRVQICLPFGAHQHSAKILSPKR